MTPKEFQLRLEAVTKEAKQYAVTNKKLVVIYTLPDRSPAFMEAEAARASGISSPLKFISHFVQTPDG